jgi:hypothetical protein
VKQGDKQQPRKSKPAPKRRAADQDTAAQQELPLDNSAGKGGDALEASMVAAAVPGSTDGSVPADVPAEEAAARAAPEQIKPDQVKTWARKLQVPAPRLREAIKRVGPSVRDVKRFLEGSRPG